MMTLSEEQVLKLQNLLKGMLYDEHRGDEISSLSEFEGVLGPEFGLYLYLDEDGEYEEYRWRFETDKWRESNGWED